VRPRAQHDLFQEQGFSGNDRYETAQQLPERVLDHRTGIPITLSLVYMEIARRAGLHIDGVNFPGISSCAAPNVGKRTTSGLLIDPFHGGALLSSTDCACCCRSTWAARSRSASRCSRRHAQGNHRPDAPD